MGKFVLKLHKRNNSLEDLLEDIKRVAKETGTDSPSAESYSRLGHHAVSTIRRRFGTWNKALDAAGLVTRENINIPEEKLFENIAEVWTKLGRQPRYREMQPAVGHSKYSPGTYENRFGTWNKALEVFVEFISGNTDSANSETQRKVIESKCKKRTPRNINWRLRAVILIRDNCICKMCGASPAKNAEVVLHVDHIVPWSKGGETTPDNLRTLCSMCNVGKSNVL